MHSKKKLIASIIILTGLTATATTQAPHAIAETMGTAYSVKAGDNLYRIALNQGVSLDELLTVNHLDKNEIIHPKQTIIIPDDTKTISTTTAGVYGSEMTAAQYDTLLAIVQQESGGQDYEAVLAVVSVMTNRVDSKSYQDSVWEVATAAGQFEAYGAGHYQRHTGEITDVTKQAVKDGLAGKKNINTLNFWTDEYAEARGVTGVNIGGNIFFNL